MIYMMLEKRKNIHDVKKRKRKKKEQKKEKKKKEKELTYHKMKTKVCHKIRESLLTQTYSATEYTSLFLNNVNVPNENSF